MSRLPFEIGACNRHAEHDVRDVALTQDSKKRLDLIARFRRDEDDLPRIGELEIESDQHFVERRGVVQQLLAERTGKIVSSFPIRIVQREAMQPTEVEQCHRVSRGLRAIVVRLVPRQQSFVIVARQEVRSARLVPIEGIEGLLKLSSKPFNASKTARRTAPQAPQKVNASSRPRW